MMDYRGAGNLLYLPLDKLMQAAGRRAPRRTEAQAPAARRAEPPPRRTRRRARATRCATARGAIDEGAVGPIVAVLSSSSLLLASSALFTVDQRQNAIVFQLGEVKDVVTKPGLHFKWPLLQNVRLLRHAHPHLRRRRAAALPHAGQPPGAGRLVRQVAHHRRARSTTSACRATSSARRRASSRPSPAALRDEFGVRTVHDVVSGEREHIMAQRAREGRPGPEAHRRRDHRRAPEARRPAAGSERVGVPPHGGRAKAHRQRAALAPAPPRPRRSAPTPTASAR